MAKADKAVTIAEPALAARACSQWAPPVAGSARLFAVAAALACLYAFAHQRAIAQPTGACCFSNGSCQTLSSANCASQGGTFLGTSTICGSGTCSPLPSHVRVVRQAASPGGDGTSWASAYSHPQEAFDAAMVTPGITQIWVAAGTYSATKPLSPSNPDTKTFHLIPGVQVYGGFAGSETQLQARNPAAHPTVLTLPFSQEPIVTITQGGEATRLDGFRFAGGLFGAIRISDASPVIRLCTIENVAATAGAVVRIDGGSPRLEHCVIKSNFLSATAAGALHIISGSPTIVDCTISDHSLYLGAGAGANITGGSPTFIRVNFLNNAAPDSSGGAVSFFNASGTFIGCRFQGNYAISGAAVYGDGNTFISCAIWDNDAAGNWGAVTGNGNTFRNCTVLGNSIQLQWGGTGAAGISGNQIQLYNTLVWGNCAAMFGCTSEATQISGTVATCRFTTIQGWTGSLPGHACDGLDPLFADPEGRLLPTSPAIDAGENATVPIGGYFDVDHAFRFFDGPQPATGGGPAPVVDRGAFEFGAATYCYPNIDQSTASPVLNVADFGAYLQLFSLAHPLANCDQSTTAPTLNVADFACFLNEFAAGCP